MITFVPKNHNIPAPREQSPRLRDQSPSPTWYSATRSQSKKTIPPMTKLLLLSATILLLPLPKANAQLLINELMQSNIDCKMDELNEFPDSWVELYNTSSFPISLHEYSIGLTADAAKAWHLPAHTVPAKGFVLVCCDKEATGLHTDFRLDSGKGGSVYLFKAGTVQDKVTNLAKQPSPNVAYGRKEDGGSGFGYQMTPTPGAPNCGETSSVILADPVFSQQGRVFEGSATHGYTVSLSVPKGSPDGTVIRYTTDGSEPTAASRLYTSPLSYSGTKVIRARLFCDGCISPRSVTHSFIVHPREMSLPVISIVTDRKFFFDDKIGIYVDGTYDKDKKNYQYDWRRPVNFEYFESPEQESILNQLCEARLSGAASRGQKYKSLAIYSNKRFGEKHFKHEFFPEDRPGLDKYKSLVLRNAGNDFDYLYMRDAVAQRSVGRYVDLDWQAYRPAIIYLNGAYYGMLNIRERANEANVYTNYDGLEDVDGIENWWDLKEGDMENMNAFKAFYNEHGHTWDEYSMWMDVDEFINLVIANAYYNNIDFFGNNIFMWRPRTEDGRWRFIAKDMDYIMGLYGQAPYNYRYFNWVYDSNYDSQFNWGANSYDATRLFRRLMEDADFKRRFIDRFAIYMGDFLNYDAVWEKTWKPMREAIAKEYPSHRRLVNPWWPDYSYELSSAQDWLRQRTAFMYSHLAEYFKLGAPVSLVVNAFADVSAADAVEIVMNEVPLSEGRFTGKFFKGRLLSLKARTKDSSEKVTGWQIRKVCNDGSQSDSRLSGDSCAFTIPDCRQLVVSIVTGTADGIENVSASESPEAPEAIYSLSGLRLKTPAKGIVIQRSKGKVTKRLR